MSYRLAALAASLASLTLIGCSATNPNSANTNTQADAKVTTTVPAPAEPVPGPFTHAPLPYAADALEPVIDAQTMQIHWGRHHRGYYDNLNRAAADNPKLAQLSLEQLMGQISQFPAGVRNNAGGAWNHDFFWASMAPLQAGADRAAPSPALLAAIERDFGSLEQMQQAFNTAGAGRFGSGWVWLIVQKGKLVITTTPNQDNPLMDVAETRGTPLLGNDVWEHAYYLQYQNKRADYLKAWWQLVDWATVSNRFAQAEAQAQEQAQTQAKTRSQTRSKRKR